MSAPILLFSPHQHQYYHRQPQPQAHNPRDRYLAALAEVKAAEEEYAESVAREKAIQRQREEEERRRVVVQRQREEAARRQRLVDAFLEREAYLAGGYPERFYYGTPEADIYEELAARKDLNRRRSAAHYQQQQAPLLDQHRLALLQEHQAREQAKARGLALARRQAEEQARLSRSSEESDLESVLSLLLGSGATVRKAPSREDLVSNSLFATLLTVSDLFIQQRHLPKTIAPRQGCSSHCAPRRQGSRSNAEVRSNEDELEQFMKLLFGRQAEAEPKEKEQSVCRTSCPIMRTSSHPYYFKKEQVSQGCSCASRCHAQAPRTSVANSNPVPVPAPKASTSTSDPGVAPTTPTTLPSLLSHMQSRLSREPEPEVAETLQSLLASFLGPAAANLERKPRVEKKNSTDSTSTTPAQSSGSSGLSLKEQLEARLRKDPNVEVHDTVQAMLASLATASAEHASTSTPSASAPGPAPKAAPLGSTTEGKGKGKAVAFDLPRVTSDVPSIHTSKDVSDSMNAVHDIEAAFNTLRTDFSFPTHLDFTPPSSVPSSPHTSDSESTLSSKLTYTANNSPVRYYEQALNALLGQLDAIESWGNEEVRKERKVVVGRVESALEDVEKEVQERFVQRMAKEAGQVVIADKGEVKAEETPLVDTSVPVVEEVIVEAPVADLEFVAVVSEPEEALDPSDTISQAAPLTEDPISSSAPESTTEEFSATEESSLDASEATVTPLVDTVDGETSPLAETSPEGLEGLSVEEAVPVPQSSYPPTAQSSYPPTPSLAEPGSESTAQPDSERLDTFLLPATSPITPKRPNVTEDADELVVVDKDHSEGSDWSEVEA